MKTPHKHAALIKAWADGATIEYENSHGGWVVSSYPTWDPFTEYRIKPEPMSNVVTWHSVDAEGYIYGALSAREKLNEHDDITLPIAVLRVEINHTDPANPQLVSATLEKP